MYRYDDAAERHAELANYLREVHPDGNNPEPLLRSLYGPVESRTEEVGKMPLQEMEKAVESYERWLAVSASV